MSDEPLLDFGTVSVYYIVWYRSGKVYYMMDMSPDCSHVRWCRGRQDAFYFYTEEEATKAAQRIGKRRGDTVSVITHDIDVIEDLELEELP